MTNKKDAPYPIPLERIPFKTSYNQLIVNYIPF